MRKEYIREEPKHYSTLRMSIEKQERARLHCLTVEAPLSTLELATEIDVFVLGSEVATAEMTLRHCPLLVLRTDRWRLLLAHGSGKDERVRRRGLAAQEQQS